MSFNVMLDNDSNYGYFINVKYEANCVKKKNTLRYESIVARISQQLNWLPSKLQFQL